MATVAFPQINYHCQASIWNGFFFGVRFGCTCRQGTGNYCGRSNSCTCLFQEISPFQPIHFRSNTEPIALFIRSFGHLAIVYGLFKLNYIKMISSLTKKSITIKTKSLVLFLVGAVLQPTISDTSHQVRGEVVTYFFCIFQTSNKILCLLKPVWFLSFPRPNDLMAGREKTRF